MKKLAILLVLVLVLGGAGGAGYWFLLREPPVAETAEAAESASLIPMSRFIELEPIILPVIREGQVTMHVTAQIAVELTKPMESGTLGDYSRELRDTLLSELHRVYAVRYVQERGYDLPIVKDRLVRASERVLGSGAVKGILFKKLDKRVPSTG